MAEKGCKEAANPEVGPLGDLDLQLNCKLADFTASPSH